MTTRKTKNLLLPGIVMLALAVTPAGAGAAEEKTEEAAAAFHDARLFCGVTPTWVHSDSLGPFSEDEWMFMSHAGFEWDVGLGLLVGIGYAGGVQAGDVFAGTYDTSLRLHEVPLTLRYRYRVFEWLEPYARLAAGPTFVHAAIRQEAWSEDRLHQQGYGFRGAAGLGVELLLPRRVFRRRGAADGGGGFTMGVAFEAGYAYRLPVAFDELKQDMPKKNEDHEKQLPQGSVNLGSFDGSGVYYAVDFVLHF